MKYPENIQEVAAFCPDYMGFIFYGASARNITDRQIVRNTKLENAGKKIGVFVNETIENIFEIVSECALDGVQLHGQESVAMCDALRKKGLMVLKAISIASASDIKLSELYQSHVDLLVFDTKTPAYGGSGKQFDWTLLNEYHGDTPFLLSGGISVEDADDILKIRHSKLVGVDINSKFEISPGLKNVRLIERFINNVKR